MAWIVLSRAESLPSELEHSGTYSSSIHQSKKRTKTIYCFNITRRREKHLLLNGSEYLHTLHPRPGESNIKVKKNENMPFEINTVLKESDFNYKKAFPRFPPGDLLTGRYWKNAHITFFWPSLFQGQRNNTSLCYKNIWASSSDEYRRVHIRQCLEDVFRH